MGRGGGGRGGGGGGYRSSGSYSSGSYRGSGASAKTSSSKSSSGKEGEGSSKTSEWQPRIGGNGGGYSSQTTRTTQSQAIHTLGPSSKECEKAFGELRSCLEANGDRMSVCNWYLSEWKKCQQKQDLQPKKTGDKGY